MTRRWRRPSYRLAVTAGGGRRAGRGPVAAGGWAGGAGPGGEFDYNIKRRAAAGEAVPFDGSGRFIMPAFPRFYASIGEHAFFYGVLDYIEIWDPATLIATDGMPPVVKEMARFYMAEKGVQL